MQGFTEYRRRWWTTGGAPPACSTPKENNDTARSLLPPGLGLQLNAAGEEYGSFIVCLTAFNVCKYDEDMVTLPFGFQLPSGVDGFLLGKGRDTAGANERLDLPRLG